jgi:hypothetical protein
LEGSAGFFACVLAGFAGAAILVESAGLSDLARGVFCKANVGATNRSTNAAAQRSSMNRLYITLLITFRTANVNHKHRNGDSASYAESPRDPQ